MADTTTQRNVQNLETQKETHKFHIVDQYVINPPHKLTVLVVGAGGNGSRMLAQLARMDYILTNLGHPGLQVAACDPKMVTRASLSRQQYSPSDIGFNKAEVFITRLNRQFSLGWDVCKGKYERQLSNIIISCVDNSDARKKISKLSGHDFAANPMYKPFYWLDIGNGDYYGQFVCGTLNNADMPCVHNIFPDILKDEPDAVSCSVAESISRQSPFINHILTDMAAQYLYELLTGFKVNYHGKIINIKDNIFNKIYLR